MLTSSFRQFSFIALFSTAAALAITVFSGCNKRELVERDERAVSELPKQPTANITCWLGRQSSGRDSVLSLPVVSYTLNYTGVHYTLNADGPWHVVLNATCTIDDYR